MHFKTSGTSHDPPAQLHFLLFKPFHIDHWLIHDPIHLEPSIGTVPPPTFRLFPSHDIEALISQGEKNCLFMFWRVIIGPHSTFSGTKKIPGISLDQWMNLNTKMVLVGDEGQPIQLTWRSCTNSASGSVQIEDRVIIIMDLTKCNIVVRL